MRGGTQRDDPDPRGSIQHIRSSFRSDIPRVPPPLRSKKCMIHRANAHLKKKKNALSNAYFKCMLSLIHGIESRTSETSSTLTNTTVV